MHIKKLSYIVLSIIVVLTVSSTYFISKLKFNYDFETYFPAKDLELEKLLQHRNQFENDTDFLIIAVENKAGVYKSSFLIRVDSLVQELRLNKDIKKIFSPTTLFTPVMGAGGFAQLPVLHIDNDSLLLKDSVRIAQYPHLVSGLISKNANAIQIIIFNTKDIKKNAGDSLIASIEAKLEKYNFDATHTAGKIKASKVYVEKMRDEIVVFIIASTILIGLFLFMAYRSAWGVVVPLITVIFSIAWTLAIMALVGKDLDLLTSLLPPILFVVAMSDMTHLLSKYLEELRDGKEKLQALQFAIKDVGLATFITAITTAIGFASLINSNIIPIQDFGIYTSIGVFVAFILAFTLLPAILVLLPKPTIVNIKNQQVGWYKVLQSLFLWICDNKYLVFSGFISIMMLSVFFISKIGVDAKLLDDISDKDPLKQDVLFLENNFGGIRPFELNVYSLDSTSLLNYEALSKLNQVETYLSQKYGVKDLFSPNNFVKSMMQASNGGIDSYYKFPNKDEFEQIKPKLNLLKKRKEFKLFMNQSGNMMRVSGKIRDEGSKRIAQKNDSLLMYMQTINTNSQWQSTLTGSSLLIDKNNTYLAQSLIEDLVISILSIALIIGVLFRQLRMIILALIPNIIPLLLIGGIMGAFHIPLKASTSIIFSIAFGIAVDDSIHFLSRFRMELALKKSVLYALKRTYLSTGKAMVVTSLILISGFATLLLSTFESTFLTGLLVGSTLFFAILADLILLPVLIILFYRQYK